MRKLLLLNIFTLSIFLCGCHGETNFTPRTDNLIFTAQTGNYILDASTDENSNLNISVIEPVNIANFKYIFKPDNVTVNYLNLTKEIPLKGFEEDSVLKIIYLGFLNSKNGSEFNFTDNEISLKYNVGNKDYFVIFSESGLPQKIKSSDGKTQIIFKGMTVTSP